MFQFSLRFHPLNDLTNCRFNSASIELNALFIDPLLNIYLHIQFLFCIFIYTTVIFIFHCTMSFALTFLYTMLSHIELPKASAICFPIFFEGKYLL